MIKRVTLYFVTKFFVSFNDIMRPAAYVQDPKLANLLNETSLR